MVTGALGAGRVSTRATVVLALVVLFVVVAALLYAWTSDGVSLVDQDSDFFSYLSVFVLIALDAVMPIFPGETTLNAAATLASQGQLDLLPIIVMGALGAIVGDSALFWIARRNAKRLDRQLTRAKSNQRVEQAFEVMNSSPGVLIIGGRYLPGMRFVVNASMGLSDIAYRRFLGWSVISGILWSTYTTVLAYEIGLALGDYPLASFIISGLVGSVAIAALFIAFRRSRRRSAEASPHPTDR
ncbi:MAG TPA: DedA family protein [Nocardioides sp.]|nr:DedA family protein [Nocardioides sp.]